MLIGIFAAPVIIIAAKIDKIESKGTGIFIAMLAMGFYSAGIAFCLGKF